MRLPFPTACRTLACGVLLLSMAGCADDAPAEPGGPVCTPPAESTYSFQRDPLTQAPFRWPDATCIRYAVAENGVRDVPLTELVAAVDQAATLWEQAECAPACLESAGTAAPATFGYEDDAERQTTLLYWVSDEAAWRARHSESAIAITTILTRPATGEIVDADIELNAFGEHTWTTDASAASADVVSVVAHELGHVLGLGHDTEAAALMFGGWDPGWVNRGLAESDLAGYCYLYSCQPDPAEGSGLDSER